MKEPTIVLYGENPIELSIPLEIKDLEEKELKDRYSRIKPLVKVNGITYDMKDFDTDELSNTAYNWDNNNRKRNAIEETELEMIEDFVCLHRYGYYGCFKPSIHEVLSQIPSKSLKEADYFEIIEEPVTAADVFRYRDVVNAGMHVSVVRTYKRV